MNKSQHKVFHIEQVQRKSAQNTQTEQNLLMAQMLNEMSLLREQMQNIARSQGSNANAPVQAQNNVSQVLLEEIRTDLAQAKHLKSELDSIHQAIATTRQELATLHFTGFQGSEMQCVNTELSEIVRGTEQATNIILAAAEAIDENANALQAACKKEHDKSMAADISEKIVSIFEACNFQDLTGQRITKIVRTLEFIEDKIENMVEVWGGLETLNTFAPEHREKAQGDASLLNGPKSTDDNEHVSQDDIDALFG